jgi:glycosyltransferase involved in cell wall biosynthesis
MKKKVKIIFVIPSLVPGGAERVMSFVSQNLNKQKFNSSLLVAGYAKDTSYDVSSIKVKYLNKSRVLFAIPSIIIHFLKEKPDIVVSSIAHLNSAIALISPIFPKTKFIGREATILSKRTKEKSKRIFNPSKLVKSSIKNLDMMICQSDDMVIDMATNYGIPEKKLIKINNPISHLSNLKTTNPTSTNKKFITVGRLTQVKGHIRILHLLAKVNIPFEYTIIGDGNKEYKDAIFAKATQLGINDYIKHIPFTKEVDKYIAAHDMYIQGSYVEGFPNALLESCVAGTPVIAFDVPGGTKEIVEHEVNGFLIKDNDEASYLNYLTDRRNWNPKIIRDSVYKKFNKEKIINDYEILFLSILNNK